MPSQWLGCIHSPADKVGQYAVGWVPGSGYRIEQDPQLKVARSLARSARVFENQADGWPVKIRLCGA